MLTPHAVTVAGNAAKVNLFAVPGGYAMPVMFAGKAASVKVTLHGLSGIADETVCEAIHAGRPRRAPIAMIRSGADVVLNVPVERGCAMVRITPEPARVRISGGNCFADRDVRGTNGKTRRERQHDENGIGNRKRGPIFHQFGLSLRRGP